MKPIRFIMLGGFLGAGKTTSMGRLAKHFQDQGLKVGLVTNDQAVDLVDTHTLREQGFKVEEVAGACFCCKFDELVEKVGKLGAQELPDIILAEPVGSCTDLVATVVAPLKDLYGKTVSVSPYAVLFKPSHGLRILRKESSGFSPKAAYIFEKQLEEADIIVINRVDEMAPGEVAEVIALVKSKFPGVPVLPVSAKTGKGMEALIEALSLEGNFGKRILDIDYDTYAEGEAELGWMNSNMQFSSNEEFPLDDVLLEVVGEMQKELSGKGAEVAHLKAIGLWEGFFGVANLVSSEGKPQLSLPSNARASEISLIINARVAIDPAILKDISSKVVARIAEKRKAVATAEKTQSFRPGRPTPTHRYAAFKG